MNDEIVLTQRDYTRLLESRNAFADTLAALAELEVDQTEERERLVVIAKNQLDKYGRHQAFVLL